MDDTEDGRPELLAVRPYARLLTMLGEQLIKNDRVALVELIKNSYDADATQVSVSFDGPSGAGLAVESVSITDDGSGMSDNVIRTHWLNPATPTKRDAKETKPTTPGGRVMQGEKGIGRFAMFKIASTARVVTRAAGSDYETVIDFDLSFLDETRRSTSAPEFVDEVMVQLLTRRPELFDGLNSKGLGATHGMQVELRNLRSSWSPAQILGAYRDVQRLRPLVPPPSLSSGNDTAELPFEIRFERNSGPLPFELDAEGDLRGLLESRSRFRVEGIFDGANRAFLLSVNGSESTVSLADSTIRGLRTYKRYFGSRPDDAPVTCGTFHFVFYVFDLQSSAPDEYRLDRDEKDLVKSHRIYLYRDGVRVLPYGDAQDDWLQLDVIRGTQRADQVLSNDQTVGFVYITQTDNPLLRDKTNREGLLEEGDAYADFVAVIQLIVAYVRRQYFGPYLEEQKKRRDTKAAAGRDAETILEETLALSDLPPAISAELTSAADALRREKSLTTAQIEQLEDLAGVGLSVETASHDIIASGTRALRSGRNLREALRDLNPPRPDLEKRTDSLIELLSFISSRLQDVQGLFVSTRQPPRVLNITDLAERVRRIYANTLEDRAVTVTVEDRYAELLARSTDAAVLQLLINLFDNALYWLDTARIEDPHIMIRLDSSRRELIFADNGPGVRNEDAPYIFEPFYSGKDENGKGLGLYIARQVGARGGFDVSLIESPDERLLPGANFVVRFREGE